MAQPELYGKAVDDLSRRLAELTATVNTDQPPQNNHQSGRRRRGVRRTFAPSRHVRYGRPLSSFPPSKLVKYSPKYEYSRLFNFPYHGASFRPRMNTTVVQIQGISRNNNPANPNTSAAVGVYYGPKCRRNAFYPLPIQFDQTANRALLEAVRCTLHNLIAMRQNELFPGWREIIIMTNSDYVKKSLSQWVWTWEGNGWNRMQGKGPIENMKAMKELQNLITFIEKTLDMAVRFWKVGKEDIAGATGLANKALDSSNILSLE